MPEVANYTKLPLFDKLSIFIIMDKTYKMNYEKTYADIVETAQQFVDMDNARPTNPLLINPPQGYSKSKLKVMIFGQETNGWCGGYEENKGVDYLLDTYKEFTNDCEGASYGGCFWNGVRSYIRSFRNLDDSASILWNNVVKVGKYSGKGCPSPEILTWQDAWFTAVLEEVGILKPDVVIFLSGPNYDHLIHRIFTDLTFKDIKGFSPRQFARLSSQYLPALSFRTYHPNYSYRAKQFDTCQTYIVDEVRKARLSNVNELT